MKTLYQVIHSPTALLAFETAARLCSFTKAAEELNVSQPAISLSVKKLERALGVSLFERRNRRIHLTESGERFYTDVSFGLMHILRSAQGISTRNQSKHVTINCSTAFAHYWLLPRLTTFKIDNPSIDLRIQTTDRDTDLEEDGTSLIVWRGPGERAGYYSTRLMGERIYPVASPAFLKASKKINSIQDIAQATLLHLDEPYRLRPDWEDWFAHQTTEYEDKGHGLRFNDYALVIQACIAGEGIAMGWEHIVSPMVSKGLLTCVSPAAYDIGYGFHVCWSISSKLSPDAEMVLNWLNQQAIL